MDELMTTKGILETATKDFLGIVDSDVVVVGAGPSGLTAARYLAKGGLKTVLFERNTYMGGGMNAGAMLFPRIVVQEEARKLLEEIGVRTKRYNKGYYVVDSIEAVSKCTSSAIDEGARIFPCICVEDVILHGKRVGGVVINWYATKLAKLHVDPLSIGAKYVIDATGHEAEVVRTLERKGGVKLNVPGGKAAGEKPMWAERAEKEIIKNTREVYPGILVAGMAANAVNGSPRMGPIFGGMLRSGKKAAEIILRKLGR